MSLRNNYNEAVVWLVTGIVILVALFITKDATCLWAFLIPALFA